jgi:hypothetical protein
MKRSCPNLTNVVSLYEIVFDENIEYNSKKKISTLSVQSAVTPRVKKDKAVTVYGGVDVQISISMTSALVWR